VNEKRSLKVSDGRRSDLLPGVAAEPGDPLEKRAPTEHPKRRGVLILIRHLLASFRSPPLIDLGGPSVQSVHQIQQLDGYLMIVAGQFVTFQVVDGTRIVICCVQRDGFRAAEVVGSGLMLGFTIPVGMEAVETGFDKSADALNGAFEILRSDVGYIPDEECEALARFHESQWIVSHLIIK